MKKIACVVTRDRTRYYIFRLDEFHPVFEIWSEGKMLLVIEKNRYWESLTFTHLTYGFIQALGGDIKREVVL